MRHSIAAFAALSLSLPAWSAEVALAGLLPNRALVTIDGGAPRSLAVGASANGVRLLALEDGAAVFEIDGKKKRLVLGAGAAASGGGADGGGGVVHLTANSRGQVVTTGSVNGVPMRFLVDTGATFVSMGAADAMRAGINYRAGIPTMMSTANGRKQAWTVKLNSVKVGDVTLHEVDGSVSEVEMPFALLGMSFLQRMEMKQEGSAMTLRKRY